MSYKLFVGGLSWDTTDSSLRTAFEQYGEVREARVVLDRDTGRSRGFAFITFENSMDAQQAMESMNLEMLDGRRIRVNEAQDRRSGSRGGGGYDPLGRSGYDPRGGGRGSRGGY